MDGRDVAEFVNQTDFLDSTALDPIAESFLALYFRDTQQWAKPVRQDKIALGLQTYVDEAMKTAAGANIFGDVADPTQTLGTARRKQYADERRRAEQREFVRAARRPGESVARTGAKRAAAATETAEGTQGRGRQRRSHGD